MAADKGRKMMRGCFSDAFSHHVDEWREEYRHQCEVRHLLRAMQTKGQGRVYVQAHLNAPAVKSRRARLVKDLNAELLKMREARAQAQKGAKS